MAKNSTIAQEQVLKEGTIQTRNGVIWDQGQGIITPQHFYFQARVGAWLGLFGFLGGLVRMSLPIKVKVYVPLASVTAIGRGRIGLIRDVFFMETREGKKYQFCSESQSWIDALRDVLQRQGGTLTQNDKERWEIQR